MPDKIPKSEDIEFKDKFIERYKQLTDFDKFKKYSLSFLRRSIRVNTLKISIAELKKRDDVSTYLSIDVFEEGWEEFVGFVPDNLMKLKPSPENIIAITCGPPIMIKYVLQNLEELGF